MTHVFKVSSNKKKLVELALMFYKKGTAHSIVKIQSLFDLTPNRLMESFKSFF